MTTLLARSSPDLAGSNWIGLAFKYGGVGGVIALVLVLWLSRSVDAKLEKQDARGERIESLINQHITATHDVLVDIRGELQKANCLVRAGKNEAAKAVCEAGR
jgi:membrane protein implicated in regulation of membrane protease activity